MEGVLVGFLVMVVLAVVVVVVVVVAVVVDEGLSFSFLKIIEYGVS